MNQNRSVLMSLSMGALIIGAAGCAIVPKASSAAADKAGQESASTVVVSMASSAAPNQETSGHQSDFSLSGRQIQGGVMLGTVPTGTTVLRFDGKPVAVAPDGTFIIAFNRDAPAQSTLVATLRGGKLVSKALNVSKRSWKIERVNIALRRSGPSAAFQKIRAPEIAQINAARRKNHNSIGWRQSFIWPVKGRISGMFGSQRIYKGQPGSYHSGVDIATGKSGTPIVAPADGVVILAAARPFSLEGNLLMVDHGMGLNSAFLHLSKIDVKNGQIVKRGQLLGRIGSTGRATGPHLHWSMKWKRARIDPILLTGPMN